MRVDRYIEKGFCLIGSKRRRNDGKQNAIDGATICQMFTLTVRRRGGIFFAFINLSVSNHLKHIVQYSKKCVGYADIDGKRGKVSRRFWLQQSFLLVIMVGDSQRASSIMPP